MGGSWARWAAWLCVGWVLVVAGVAGAAPEDRQASDHALVPPPVREEFGGGANARGERGGAWVAGEGIVGGDSPLFR